MEQIRMYEGYALLIQFNATAIQSSLLLIHLSLLVKAMRYPFVNTALQQDNGEFKVKTTSCISSLSVHIYWFIIMNFNVMYILCI